MKKKQVVESCCLIFLVININHKLSKNDFSFFMSDLARLSPVDFFFFFTRVQVVTCHRQLVPSSAVVYLGCVISCGAWAGRLLAHTKRKTQAGGYLIFCSIYWHIFMFSFRCWRIWGTHSFGMCNGLVFFPSRCTTANLRNIVVRADRYWRVF